MRSEEPQAIFKSVLLLCLTITSAVNPCVSAPEKGTDLTQLADNVYARIVNPDGDAVGNSGILVLEQSVLVFDTHFTPEAARALLASIRSVTPKPVRYVVNSHFHPDHTHGNQVFENAQIIGSANTRRYILESDLPSLNRTINNTRTQIRKLQREMEKADDSLQRQNYRDQVRSRQRYLDDLLRLHILAPQVTTDDSMTILEGEKAVELRFLGKGHTDGDLVLIFPWARVVFLGDLFFNEAIPNVQDASILQWMDTLQRVLKIEADIFVPGHGAVGDKKAVERFLNYFKELKTLVEAAMARGDSMEQSIDEMRIPAKYSEYRFQNFFPANVQRMYEELRAMQIASAADENPPKSENGKKKK